MAMNSSPLIDLAEAACAQSKFLLDALISVQEASQDPTVSPEAKSVLESRYQSALKQLNFTISSLNTRSGNKAD